MRKQFNYFVLLFVLIFCISVSAQKEVITSNADVSPYPSQNQYEPSDMAQWDVLLMFGTVTLSGAGGNAGAEWDGQYFYSTRWASNLIHKYNSTGTALVETFSVPGVSGLRDLAYDGQYFYGGAALTTIYQMDFNTHTLIGTITSPVNVRNIAYDSDLDAFWVSDWSTNIVCVSRTGTVLHTITANPSISSNYGSAYDNVSPGGPYLWIFSQGAGSGPQYIYQLHLPDGTPTGVSHDVVTDMPVTGGIAGGLFSMTDFLGGHFTIGGLYQSSDALGNDEMFVYDILSNCPVGAPENPNPANNTVDVNINLSSISWTNGAGATQVEVFFGEAGNVVSVYSGTPITSWSIPSTLNYFTNYQWKVICKNDTCETQGPIWGFRTIQDPNLVFVTDYFYPQNANYWTGTTDGTTKTDVSEVRGVNLEDGWFMYDISSMPAGAVVDSIRFYGYVNLTYYPFWSATPLPGLNPLTATASELKAAITANSGSGVAYAYQNETSTFATGWHNYILGTTANADMEAAIIQGWFAMGMDSRDNSATYYINWDGWNQTNIPYLKVSYHYSGGGGNIFTENFDSFTAGQQVACQDPVNWTTWTNLPCDPVEDAYISSTYSYSPSNSAVIVQNNDLVKLLGAKTSGKWYMSIYFYIPTGKAGYFNALAEYVGTPQVWGVECYFDAGGAGRLLNGSTVNFTWLPDVWQQALLIVDLDLDQAEFWIGSDDPLTQVGTTWAWTRGGSIPLKLDANDFFGATVNDQMYMDNYYFGDVMPPIIPVELTSFAAAVSNGNVNLSWSTATETNNQGFEIQRSSGSEFVRLGFVQGHGTTTEISYYTFTDNNVAPGKYTYRLKQVDYDGTYEYFTTEADVTAPKVFALEQNYPNPFNPSTKINFSLAVDSKVTLKIFDVLGQEVRTLINSDLKSGTYTINFNAYSLNSGVYFYRLEASGVNGANYNNVKKMILTK